MNHEILSPQRDSTKCINRSMQSEGYRKTSEQSALSSFFTEMLNKTSVVELHIDNARSRRRCRSSSPPSDQFLTSPKKDRASIRWELLASKDHNDVMVTAPLRRRVSHEPLEKLMSNRFAQQAAATHAKCTALSMEKQSLPVPPQAMTKDTSCESSPCNSSVSSTTSDLLAEALDLLSTSSSGDNNNVKLADARMAVPCRMVTAEDATIVP